MLLRISVLIFSLLALRVQAQCTYSCDTYHASEIPYHMYPADGDTLMLLDDDITTTMPIGFNFDFYCNTYNQLRICSNGFITFDFGFISASGTPYAQNLPSTVTPNGVIAWNWNDLDPSQGGSVTYTTTGTTPNQKFVLTYSNVPLWTPQNPPSTIRNTGQIVLHESTHLIEINIKEANNNGWLYHTEGIEDPTATKGVSIAGRNLALWTASLSSYLFSPYATGLAPQLSGDTVLCQGDPAAFATTTLSNASGYHWSFPPGWTGTGSQQTTTTNTAIAGAAGVVSVAAIYTCGNSPAATLEVHVVPSPTISLSFAGPSVVCSGSSFTVLPSGASFYTLDPGNMNTMTSFVTYPLASGVFTVSGYSANSGCYALNTLTIPISVLPSPTITVNSGTICKGNSFTMVPNGAFQYTYSGGSSIVSPQVPGIYSYSVWTKGANGCTSDPAVSIVSVAPLPVVTISPDRPVLCAGETVKLLAMGAQSYTWTGLSGHTSTVLVSPPFSMVYTVIGEDINGCISHGNGSLTVNNCVGIAEHKNSKTELFPNPASGNITLRSENGGFFFLTDQLGRTVGTGETYPGENMIPLPLKGVLYLTYFLGETKQTFLVVSQ